jgi:transcriptional regulator NrdR family protein
MSANQRTGLACPSCGIRDSRVIQTRGGADHVRRRRECRNGHRFSTRETVVESRPPRITSDVRDTISARLDEVFPTEHNR